MSTMLTPEGKIARRIEKLRGWIVAIQESARDLEAALLSRDSEMASASGIDPKPKKRPCEHRPEWRLNKLCLACNNTGLRPATEKEIAEGLAYDPYLINPVPSGRYHVVSDESEGARRARGLAQLDAAIARLERDSRQREGLDVRDNVEEKMTRVLDSFSHALGRDGRKVLRGLLRLREASPDLYRQAVRGDELALALLARVVPGKLRNP